MKRLIIFASVLILLLVACTLDGEMDENSRNRLIKCTDTRDGEIFYYNTNTVTNVRVGIGAPTSFDIMITDGKRMTLNSDMEVYLKCVEVDSN